MTTDAEPLPEFCSFCGRRLRLRPDVGGWHVECPKYFSIWSLMFTAGMGREHTWVSCPRDWEPAPRFDPMTGGPNR